MSEMDGKTTTLYKYSMKGTLRDFVLLKTGSINRGLSLGCRRRTSPECLVSLTIYSPMIRKKFTTYWRNRCSSSTSLTMSFRLLRNFLRLFERQQINSEMQTFQPVADQANSQSSSRPFGWKTNQSQRPGIFLVTGQSQIGGVKCFETMRSQRLRTKAKEFLPNSRTPVITIDVTRQC